MDLFNKLLATKTFKCYQYYTETQKNLKGDKNFLYVLIYCTDSQTFTIYLKYILLIKHGNVFFVAVMQVIR